MDPITWNLFVLYIFLCWLKAPQNNSGTLCPAQKALHSLVCCQRQWLLSAAEG